MKKPGYYTLDEIRKQDISLKAVRNSHEGISIVTKAAFKNKPEQVIFTGCGTSFYLAATISNYFIQHLEIPSMYLSCSELELNSKYYIKNRKTLIIPFTRSSATSEVKSSIIKCRSYPNVKSLAISCDAGSSEYNDYTILCTESDEKSIVMTRSFSSMLYAGMIMIKILEENNLKKIFKIPEISADFISSIEIPVKELAHKIKDSNLLVALGQAEYYGIAGESSIKIKEMCIMPTEIYYTMEYRHGPISIADKNTVAIIYTSEKSKLNDLRLVKELVDLDVKVICIGEKIAENFKDSAYAYFEIPECSLPLFIIPAQFLGLYWALEKGIDPDTPRNLNKAIVL